MYMGRKRKVSDEEFIRVAEGNPRNLTAERLNISLRTVDRYAKRLGARVKFSPDVKGRKRDIYNMTDFQHKTLYLLEMIPKVTGKDNILYLEIAEALKAIMEILGCCHDTAIKWHNFLFALATGRKFQ